MKFTKMQGLGNDYIYLDCMERVPEDPSALSILLSRSHFGVGADGLVLMAAKGKCAATPPGALGNMCTNGG